MRILMISVLSIASLGLGSCIARTAASVVTAPVRVASTAVDLATTSQSEADEARGREIRQREERLGRLQREYAEEAEDCDDGDDRACRNAVEIRREMDTLIPTIPLESEED